jgi:hypothetical protein
MVLVILREYYITDSQKMVTRWIRQGKLNGVISANRKDGYLVSEEDLCAFIEELSPGLPQVMNIYKDHPSTTPMPILNGNKKGLSHMYQGFNKALIMNTHLNFMAL